MRTWGWNLLALSGVGGSLPPKLPCALCWRLSAGIISPAGLVFFLTLAVAALAFHAKQRCRYGPFVLGLLASGAVLIGQFYFESSLVPYGGMALLFVAHVWNAWPHKIVVPNETIQLSKYAKGTHE